MIRSNGKGARIRIRFGMRFRIIGLLVTGKRTGSIRFHMYSILLDTIIVQNPWFARGIGR